MNRRYFTASLAALFAVPAMPAVASLVPAATSQTAASHFATAKLLARAHNRCSPAMLQRLLRVDSAIDHELNAMLLKRGVISAASAKGASIATNPLNTHCITKEATTTSNITQKLQDAKARLNKVAELGNRTSHKDSLKVPDQVDQRPELHQERPEQER